MNMDLVGSIVRSALLAGGGVLVTNGLASQADVQSGVGCIMGLVGLGWSIWQKYQARKILVAAVNTPAPTEPVATVAQAISTIQK